MSEPFPLNRAACYAQDDDDAWLAARADTEHRPYMISGTGNALHRRGCGHPDPCASTEYTPRPVYLTATEAAAFLDESDRRHPCGTCGPDGWLDHLAERRPHRHVPCGLGWPSTRPGRR